MTGWEEQCYAGVEMLREAAVAMNTLGTSMKKCHCYHNNDKQHLAKSISKRRKRNKNKKTHRK